MAIRDVQRRFTWVMLPVQLFEALLSPQRWACTLSRVADVVSRVIAFDTTGLGRVLNGLFSPLARLRAALARRSSAVRHLDWWLRRCFWSLVWGALGFARWPRKASVPSDERPIWLVPAPETYGDFKSPALVVPTDVPCSEKSLFLQLAVQGVHLLQDLYPVVTSHQPLAARDLRERLRNSYPWPFRLVRKPPAWHPDLDEAGAEKNLLGALAVGGPFAKLLERSAPDSDDYHVDLLHLHDYEVREGLASLGCKICYRQTGARLAVTGVEHQGGRVSPEDDGWELAERVALAALVTHLTVWRQGMEYHVGGLAPVPVVTHNMPPKNPLRRLLAPHMMQTLTTNFSTHLTLRRSGFDVKGFAFPYETILRYYDDGARDFDIRRLDVAADTERRGIPESLDYPWLPLTLRYREIFETYVQEYVDHYYPDEETLAADVAVRIWFDSLDHHLVGGIRSYVPELDKANLVKLATLLIYSASVGHSENSLWNYASFLPTTVKSDGELPSVGDVQVVMNFQFLICSSASLLLHGVRHVALDDDGRKIMRRFEDRLQALQRELEAQPGRYWFLYPEEVEASVAA